MTTSTHTYYEVQRLNQWWLQFFALGMAGVGWWGFVQQILLGIPFGNHPTPDWAIWILTAVFGLILPILLFFIRMTTEVVDGKVIVTYFPIYKLTILLDNIHRVEVKTYKPLYQYGGWGIRWVPSRGWAYSVSGNQGVYLELDQGHAVLIGSQTPKPFAQAIQNQLGTR